MHAVYALFESKQFGALIRGRVLEDLIAKDDSILKMEPREVNKIVEQELITRAEAGNPFLKVIQGVSYTGDPFYTTGQEYNLQKALAQKNNNFVDLLNAYLKTTGPREVRDIQDMYKRWFKGQFIDFGCKIYLNRKECPLRFRHVCLVLLSK